jgi:hypothetical protein
MKIQAPHIYENAVVKCERESAPIFFVDISYNILKARGKTVSRLPYKAEKRVLKGFKESFSKDPVKRDALKSYFNYDRDRTQFKKLEAFDLSKIEITGVTFVKFLGFGIKSS